MSEQEQTWQEILQAWIGMGEYPTREEMSLVTLAKVREAIRALLADDRAFRLALFFMCPHDMKYGDDGEMQCRGADLKRLPVEDVAQHVVGALREWREKDWAERDALRLDLAEACRGAAVLARERNGAQGERDDWRERFKQEASDHAVTQAEHVAWQDQCITFQVQREEVKARADRA